MPASQSLSRKNLAKSQSYSGRGFAGKRFHYLLAQYLDNMYLSTECFLGVEGSLAPYTKLREDSERICYLWPTHLSRSRIVTLYVMFPLALFTSG